jgi:hypothetical protein
MLLKAWKVSPAIAGALDNARANASAKPIAIFILDDQVFCS